MITKRDENARFFFPETFQVSTKLSTSYPLTIPSVREGNVDANGLRFCRACCKHIPTSHFPAGQRRFLCKRHIWEKIGKAAKARLRSDPLKRELARLWSLCYNDRGLFCQTRVAITQTDIARLLVISETGEEVLLEVNPEEHVERGSFKGLEGKTWNHPVVVGDRLFIRNGEEAACYRLPGSSTELAVIP